MKIVQLLVTLQRGDAIGNFTLALHEMLCSKGYDAEIYAYNIGTNIKNLKVKDIKYFKNLKTDDLIIYQMCEGHSINELIRKQSCKKIAIYHNVTPASFFSQFGKEYQVTQKKAEQVLQSMRNVFDKCIADSEFNKENLISMGYFKEKIVTVPLYVEFDDYEKSPDYETIRKYNDEYVNILFVGRFVPNKKQEDIIRIFAYYHKFINKKSRLFIIGSPFIPDYNDALKEYIEYLGISDSVIMPGHSTFPEILSYYRCADIFLCMSEHEGFCVPLIEAMLFEVPIVAYKSSAIPYTLGKSGVVVDTKEPEKIAEIIDTIVSDEELFNRIVKSQKERLEDFKCAKLKNLYLKEIKDVLGED